MKFNFGHGVVMVMLCFMTGMSYLVYRCSQQSIGLVNQEYYNDELKYSDQMNKERNALVLNGGANISFNDTLHAVVVTYPEMKQQSEISGEILFFKPDNSAFDFTVPVKMDANHVQQINASKIARGTWRVKINWKAAETAYYNEEKIYVN